MAALNILSFMAIFELAIAIPSRDPHVNFNAIFDVKVYEDEGPNNNQNCPCCPFDWSPVCGADDSHSMSFSNQCFLNLAIKCDPKFENYKLLHDKECYSTTTRTSTTEPTTTTIPGFKEACSGRNRSVISPSGDQCFVLFDDQYRTWDEANSKCKYENLQLAKPEDHNAVWLRQYVMYDYGTIPLWRPVWLGARGNGTYIRWVRNQEILQSTNPLWLPTTPPANVGYNFCLRFLTHPNDISANPNEPYWPQPCNTGSSTDIYYTLCEMLKI